MELKHRLCQLGQEFNMFDQDFLVRTEGGEKKAGK